MQKSDPTSIYLAVGSLEDKALSLWNLRDLLVYHTALLYDAETHNSLVKAISWNPRHENLLATGGYEHDQIIRIWDMNLSEDDMMIHSIRCNSKVTSVGWRKADVRKGSQLVFEGSTK